MIKSFLLSDELYSYLDNTFGKEADVLKRLREETEKMPEAGMQIGPDQGQFLSFLIKAIGATRALEVGVFTGYSSIVTALALPKDGRLIACDISEEFTATAKRYWQEAGVSDKIELRLGPALDTLDQMVNDHMVFDFAFIDADKPNYCAYYERVVQMLKPNGVVALDNTLWKGRVADPSDTDEATVAIRQLNEMVARDSRVEALLIPMGDGMTVARRL